MIDQLFCYIKAYPTIFVGLLGFSGVITTMIFNAKMQRNLHDRALRHQTNSLRVAIKSELNSNKQSYEYRIEQFNEPSKFSDALFPSKIENEIYKQLISNIGLLTDEEVEKIINAYALISEIPYRVRILVGTDSIGGHNDEFIRLKGDQKKVVSKIHENILPDIVEAIDTIEKYRKNA